MHFASCFCLFYSPSDLYRAAAAGCPLTRLELARSKFKHEEEEEGEEESAFEFTDSLTHQRATSPPHTADMSESAITQATGADVLMSDAAAPAAAAASTKAAAGQSH